MKLTKSKLLEIIREEIQRLNEGKFKKGDTVRWIGDKTVTYKIEKDFGNSNKTGVAMWKIVQTDNPKRGAIAGEPDLKKESVNEGFRDVTEGDNEYSIAKKFADSKKGKIESVNVNDRNGDIYLDMKKGTIRITFILDKSGKLKDIELPF